MVQIHTPQPRQAKQSFGEKYGLNQAAANLIGSYSQANQQNAQNEQMDQAIQRLTGQSAKGLDFESKQKFLQMAQQAKQQQELEQSKQLFKTNLQDQKQDFLNKLFGGGQQQMGEGQEPTQMSQPQQGMGGLDASQLTDEHIALATSMDPNLGRALGHAKDVALREKRENDRLLKESERHEEKMDYQSFKDNKDYTSKLLGGLEAYKRDKMVLDQMSKIASKGTLPKPMSVSLLNKLGIPLGVLENADAEQFDKLSTELLKNIQGTFGNRILQSEVQLFMKSIPTLLNSPQGQRKLIDQWQILNEGKKIYYDAYKDIKKENPKRLPRDLHEQVLERAEPKLDLLADNFRRMNEPSSVKMRGPDGSVRNVPREFVDQALQSGGELLE